ncbi:hypothetical protein [Haloarcula laminariae]|uniref:hypothetical protein n=1 Tax=Haloarcula laminariae TaxID=2961577 RepID=UPI0024067AF3|nr:hypothetical protein [Halomicroarcula sp. FL173]
MATDKRKVYAGVALLAVSSVLILASGPFDIGISTTIAGVMGGAAALGLAAGALLVGTSGDGRAV